MPETRAGSERELTTARLDRAAGVLVAQACGDALGVPYEFATLPPSGEPARMLGGGLGSYAPGEYSDDTQMAAIIARVAADGSGLTNEEALDRVARGFLDWHETDPADVGAQTRRALTAAGRGTGRPAARLRAAARALHERTGKTAGNGALMRTAPVALAHLGEAQRMATAAREVAELTHADPLAGDACVLWCAGVDTAVREGTFAGVRRGLDLLPAARRDQWADWVGEAERQPPDRFAPNGFTVPALQAAYAAVTGTPVPLEEPEKGSFACQHLQHALQAAVRAGDDTDTVAAIAGALLGARWGVSAVPFGWRRMVHGWPGLRARDLIRLGVLTARGGQADADGWPAGSRVDYQARTDPAVPHPSDPDVLLGTAGSPTTGIEAVVSLCRLGADQVPADGVRPQNHVEFWLADTSDPAANPNLAFAIDDAARTVATLRDEGRGVLLHCAHGRSRTLTVAARYAVLRGVPLDRVLPDVRDALPGAQPNPLLWDIVRRLGDQRTAAPPH